jgi:hypothetical protein
VNARAFNSGTTHWMKRALAFLLILAPMLAAAQSAGLNSLILEQIREMPKGGQYAATRVATIRLQSAAHFESGKFFVLPDAASPSYCSGATYLVFLKTIEQLRAEGRLTLPPEALNELLIKGQRDGQGVWGRWNANGPGTARLFHELGLGRNFSDFAQARPGDFMKIFWTPEVGARERGHSVIYMGSEMREGTEFIRFWSSNQPAGYGEKAVPRSQIARVVFSRLETPGNLARSTALPPVDTYLASLLSKPSTGDEVAKKCGLNK